MEYQSEVEIESASMPGVKYRIARMSFARRMELIRRIRDLAAKAEFLEAGGGAEGKLDAALLAREVDRAYLGWGLIAVTGLDVDGEPATPETLIERGPEELASEIAAAVKRECGLTAEERKN
jgi:hypothetical protein